MSPRGSLVFSSGTGITSVSCLTPNFFNAGSGTKLRSLCFSVSTLPSEQSLVTLAPLFLERSHSVAQDALQYMEQDCLHSLPPPTPKAEITAECHVTLFFLCSLEDLASINGKKKKKKKEPLGVLINTESGDLSQCGISDLCPCHSAPKYQVECHKSHSFGEWNPEPCVQ